MKCNNHVEHPVNHLRAILVSDSNQMVAYEFPISDAETSNGISSSWLHSATVFNPTGAVVYNNGVEVGSGMTRTITASSNMLNMFTLNPFTELYTGSTMTTDVYVGARADENAGRHFSGKIAGVRVSYDSVSERLTERVSERITDAGWRDLVAERVSERVSESVAVDCP